MSLTALSISLSDLNDSGFEFCADGGTMAIALSGYVLLFLGILVLIIPTRATLLVPVSTSPTPSADV